jgi:hypothetical protein
MNEPKQRLDAGDLLGQVVDLPVELIVPDPQNLRESFDEEDILDLGRNIQQVGQLDEITVFPIYGPDGRWTGKYDLHDGERRWRAAKAVGLQTLKAKVEPRPSPDVLLYKKMSRALQTRTLPPERKVVVLERGLAQLGILHQPHLWESFRQKLGGGQDWPQIVRVLNLGPGVRDMMESGSINFTLAQSIGRLPKNRQEEAARFVVLQKINGRYFSTQIVPYLLEHPEATMAQAFEHTKVGDWRQYLRSPYEKGQEPPLEQRLEDFLEICVKWERAWEILVHTGLVHDIAGKENYEFRLADAARRIAERASALHDRVRRQKSTVYVPRELPAAIRRIGEKRPE